MKKPKAVNLLMRAVCTLLAVCMLAGAVPVKAEAVEYGIDVSKWQGQIDWQTVAQSGVQFAFVRVGTSDWLDDYFYPNMIAAQQAGIKTGVYIYSHAKTVEDAAKDAQFVLNAIQDVQVSYPVVWDVEADYHKTMSPDTLALMANTFCAIIEAAGYYPMVYSSTSWFKNTIGPIAYDKWVAHWYVPACGIPEAAVWQYSDKGSIPGINGAVDLDVAIKDFSSSIVNTGWVARKGFMYFYINYKMYRGWLDLGAAKYYFDPLGRMVTGWLPLEDGVYFMQPDGTMTVGLTPIGNGFYFFGADGKMLTGLQTLNGQIYYFTPEGVMYVGFLDLPNGRMCFAADGHMLTGFNVLEGKTYYFDAKGIMQTGLQIIDNKVYFFMADGSMYTGWFNDGTTVKYFETDGHMTVGLATINGSIYYFDMNGNMQTGVVDIGGVPYVFGVDGKMIIQ